MIYFISLFIVLSNLSTYNLSTHKMRKGLHKLVGSNAPAAFPYLCKMYSYRYVQNSNTLYYSKLSVDIVYSNFGITIFFLYICNNNVMLF